MFIINIFIFFFFFQAEDGIRDHCVTGVQTCALPIYGADGPRLQPGAKVRSRGRVSRRSRKARVRERPVPCPARNRSEERRVGKECRSRRSAEPQKKKRGKI